MALIPVFRKASDWLARNRRPVKRGAAATSYLVFNSVFDFFFYPAVMTAYGLVLGGSIAVSISLVQCSVMFWLYDKMKIDWLGAEMLRKLESTETQGKLTKIATWIGKEKKTIPEKLSAVIAFIVLAGPIDPLVVAVHFKRNHFNGLSFKDWGLLLAAVGASNAWWLVQMAPVAAALRITFLGHV